MALLWKEYGGEAWAEWLYGVLWRGFAEFTPSEGVFEEGSLGTPLEGVRGMLEMETRLQAFSGRCCFCLLSEGGKKYGGGAGGVGGGNGKLAGKGKVLYFWELFRKMFGTMARFKDRRSIRKYSRRGIPEGLIEALAGEASRASGRGGFEGSDHGQYAAVFVSGY